MSGGIYKQPGVADLDLVQSLKFSPDGTLLASGGFRTVKLWRKTERWRRRRFAGVAKQTVAFAARCRRQTASAEERNGTVEVVEVASGQRTEDAESRLGRWPPSLPAARWQAARIGGPDGNAKLWDVESGKQIAELKGDIRATLKVGELTRAAALAKKHIELAKKDLEEANTRKKAEEENKKKSAEALTKAEDGAEAQGGSGEESDRGEDGRREGAGRCDGGQDQGGGSEEGGGGVAGQGRRGAEVDQGEPGGGWQDRAATKARRPRLRRRRRLREVEALRKLLEPRKQSRGKGGRGSGWRRSPRRKESQGLGGGASKGDRRADGGAADAGNGQARRRAGRVKR